MSIVAGSRLRATRIVQQALSILMQGCWLFAWSAAIGAWIDRPLGPLLQPWHIAVLLILPSALMPVVISVFAGKKIARYALAALGVVLSVLAGLIAGTALGAIGNQARMAELMSQTYTGLRVPAGVILALVGWWRGITVGRDPPTVWRAEVDLRRGILAIGVLLVTVAVAGERSAPDSGVLVWCALALVAAGLIAVPLGRIYDEASQPRHRGSTALAPSGPWLTTLLAVVGGLLLIVFVLSQVLTYERLDAMIRVLLLPFDALLWLFLNVLLVPIAYLVEALVLLMRSLLPPSGNQDFQPQGNAQRMPDLADQLSGNGLPPEVTLILRLIAVALVVFTVMSLLALAASRLGHWWRSDDVSELRDIVWRWPTWREIWAWLRGRLREVTAMTSAPGSSRAAILDDDTGPRGIYRRFLALGASIGRARRSPETPGEYEGRLTGDPALPGAAEVEVITDAYEVARYGPENEPGPSGGDLPAALERLRAAWQDRRPV